MWQDSSIRLLKTVIVPFARKRYLRGLKEPTLSGHTLKLTTKVRNLALTLDNWLTWKALLKNVMNKAYRAFWTCNCTSGKTGNPGWCVGSAPWWSDMCWPTAPQSGGKRSDTMATVEVLLGLPPFHVLIEAEDQVGSKFMCTKHCSPNCANFCHTKNLWTWNMEHELILQIGSDR